MKTMSRILFFLMITFTYISSTSGQDIYQAVRNGDLLQVKEILAVEPDILDIKNEDALTPLNLACEQGQAGIVDYLLHQGADPYIGDNENSMPIHLAAISGSLESIDLLLAAGVDINLRDDNGMTPLLFAISRRTWAAEHLMKLGADINLCSNTGWSPIHLAIVTRNDALAMELIQKGANVDVELESGATPLHSAVSFGNLEIVKLLVENGADIHAETDRSEQPLGWAVNPNTLDAAAYLIEQGADINDKNSMGQTVLHNIAGRGRSLEGARLILDKGANIDAPDSWGRTPLYMTVWAENPEDMAKFLILNGANVNPSQCMDKESCTCFPNFSTPLHGAVRHNKLALAEILIHNGAKVNVFNADGQTPLHCAVQGGDPDVVKLLVDEGAFMNVKDLELGYSELHFAVMMGFNDIVELLIEKGADASMVDMNGKTAFDMAMYYNHRDIAYQLLASGAPDHHLNEYLNKPDEIQLPVAEGEARVWFLGHSGWAVKTANHFLVFDYFCSTWDRQPDDSCLASGYILPETLADENVTVFSTHAHADHYDPYIFSWKEANPDINYVLCWNQNTEGHEYTLVPIHEEKEIDDMNVYAHYSTDLGGGYLVEVDGITILHMGDHANGSNDLMAAYTDEVDQIKEQGKDIDILFGGIRGCSLGEPEQVKKGIYYTLETLQPELFVPMHAGGHSIEFKKFIETAEKDGISINMKYMLSKGDRFLYKRTPAGATTSL